MYNLSGFLAFKTVYMFEHIQYDTKMHNRSPLSIDLCVVHVLSYLKVHYDQRSFKLCLYVADPATCLASMFWGTLICS